jgi:hypothetical protein
MKKSKTDMALSEVVIPSKPIVKPYFDKDAEIIKWIELVLPHIKGSSMKAHRVFQSKCGRVLKFRVNFYSSIWTHGEICPKNHIVSSKYVQIDVNLDDIKFKLTDLTQI